MTIVREKIGMINKNQSINIGPTVTFCYIIQRFMAQNTFDNSSRGEIVIGKRMSKLGLIHL